MIVRCVRIFQNYLALRPELEADPLGLIHVGDEFEVQAIVASRTDVRLGIELPESNGVMCSIQMFEVIDPTLPSEWQAIIDGGELLIVPPGIETRLTQEGHQRLWGEPTAVWKRAQAAVRPPDEA